MGVGSAVKKRPCDAESNRGVWSLWTTLLGFGFALSRFVFHGARFVDRAAFGRFIF